MGERGAESVVRFALDAAGIQVGGDQPWDIQVHDPRFYGRVLGEGALGLGESYMDRWWDTPALDQFIDRLLRARLQDRVRPGPRLTLRALRARLFNLQSRTRAFQVGQEHYDVGNDLYRAMLDRRMNYTCAYWRDAETLDEAQEAKLDLVCRKLALEPGMSVLELGCGWGSFAGFAAERYGVRVLGVTVSAEQVRLGQSLTRDLPVELRLQDYREVTGQYDRVVSIGILEHVGHRNYRTFMEVMERCLAPGGLAFAHTIGGNISTTAVNPWFDRYIFPNGALPSIAQLGEAMERLFVLEDWHNIGPDYDPTLMAWYRNVEAAWDDLDPRYDRRFRRMWRFYLLASAGAFRSRSQQLWQMVMTRWGDAQPVTRLV